MSVKLGSDTDAVAVAGYGPVQMWSLSGLRQVSSVSGHIGMVYGLALAADETRLATGGADGSLRLWDLDTGACVAILAQYDSAINNVALSGDGRLLAAAVLGKAFDVYATDRGERVASLPMGAGQSSWAIALSEDGRVLGCGGEDGVVRVWDTLDQRQRLTLEAHEGGALACALSRDGGQLATSGGDGRVRLWSTDSGQAIDTWQEHFGGVWAVDISRDGRWIVSGGLDGTARVWKTNSPTSVHVLRSDRPYERMDITGLTGVTDAQRMALMSLGAVNHAATRVVASPKIG